MNAPSSAVSRQLSDLCLDARTEEELFWRWHYADGEARGMQSNWSEYHGRLELNRDICRVRTVEGPDGGGVTEDVGYRCGPVYVPSGQHCYPAYEMDLSGMRAYHRLRRIDAALSQCSHETVNVLRLAFHDRPCESLLCLCPVTSRGPALCNLVELTPAALREWKASRTLKPLRVWLARLSAKAAAGGGDARLRRELTMAANLLLAAAGREYASRRRAGT